MDENELYRRLRALVGRTAMLDGVEWQVLEVLPDEEALVLYRLSAGTVPIQPDAYGNASRRAPETRLVRYADTEGITDEALVLLGALQPA
jgi:hypothetical protein